MWKLHVCVDIFLPRTDSRPRVLTLYKQPIKAEYLELKMGQRTDKLTKNIYRLIPILHFCYYSIIIIYFAVSPTLFLTPLLE